jgi:predicted SAM-dependent methyltransferase
VPFDRFEYQRWVVSQVPGKVLNVGCNEDPAKLKTIFGERVVNCDIADTDYALDRPNDVDVLFDAAREKWPFADDEAELVVMGDIIEHLRPDDAEGALVEARRVGKMLCVTVPCETRPEELGRQAPEGNEYQFHQTTVTRDYLDALLERTGWEPFELLEVDYGFLPLGFVLRARRSDGDGG